MQIDDEVAPAEADHGCDLLFSKGMRAEVPLLLAGPALVPRAQQTKVILLSAVAIHKQTVTLGVPFMDCATKSVAQRSCIRVLVPHTSFVGTRGAEQT
jgi:hypothetical protein